MAVITAGMLAFLRRMRRDDSSEPDETPLGSRLFGRFLVLDGGEYECLIEAFSLSRFRVKAAIQPEVARPVFFDIDGIGLIIGTVLEHSGEEGFSVKPFVAPERRDRLMQRVAWQRDQDAEAARQRAADRIVPAVTSTTLRLSEKMVFKATIVNVSMTGALLVIHDAWKPLVGSTVMIGSTRSLVVRHTQTGFAVRFETPIPSSQFSLAVVL